MAQHKTQFAAKFLRSSGETPLLALWLLRSATLSLLTQLGSASIALADHQPLTRAQILNNAKDVRGNGYQWGGSTWSADPARKGVCVLDPPGNTEGCPDQCTYPDGDHSGGKLTGSDCTGFLSKVWETAGKHLDNEVQTSFHVASNAYTKDASNWSIIPIDQLQPGDAVALGSHVMLFKGMAGAEGPPIWIEAKGCAWGMTEGKNGPEKTLEKTKEYYLTKKKPAKFFVGVRRSNLTEDRTCEPNTCSGHGKCTSGICTCDKGYAGGDCERCDKNYLGYPTCAPPDATCKPLGDLRCGNTYPIPTASATKTLSKYSCSVPQAEGSELTYRFVGGGHGHVKLALKGGAGLALLENMCAAESCTKADAKNIEFNYSPNGEYYIALETGGLSADLALDVQCESSDPPWIGDTCENDAKCMYTKANGTQLTGTCYKTGTEAKGFCTLDCKSNGCPDTSNKAPTACVATPSTPDQGMCVPVAHELNQYCTAVTGAVKQTEEKFNKPGVQVEVCGPPIGATSCVGTIRGRVLDGQGMPLLGAEVSAGSVTPSAKTNMLGEYSIMAACDHYTLTYSHSGDDNASGDAIVEHNKSTTLPDVILRPHNACEAPHSLSGSVINGLNSTRELIAGASLELRYGANATSGPMPSVVQSSDGTFKFDNLSQAGPYTLVVSAPGYASATAAESVCGATKANDIALAPEAKGAVMRIVLNWAKPEDLDLHVQTSNDEVYYRKDCRGSSAKPPYMTLDVDRQVASGPEVVTVFRALPQTATVFVHNFSQQVKLKYPDSYDAAAQDFSLTASEATVVAYDGAGKELGRFSAPTSGEGFYWDVFSFESGDGGVPKLTPINRLTNARPNPDEEYPDNKCHP